MKKDNKYNFCVYLIAFFIIFLAFPFLTFLEGYLTGVIIQITLSSQITYGLSIIGINITKEQIPALFGTISMIGSFFYSTNVLDKLMER